jgi:peptidylprolyl isomerase
MRFVSWPRMSRLPILLACLLLAVFAASCGDDEEEAAAPAETPTATPEPAGTVDVAGIGKDLDTKPKVAKPTGSPPAELQTTDIVKGKGKAAKSGDTVSVQYVGNSWSTGTQFDASWDRGQEPFQFPLGAGQVIPGWDQGVAGMKEGGRRLLVIPPDLAYGDQSPSPDIGPNETLIFVVDLEKIS